MLNIKPETVKRAARAIKILYLARQPGMDTVAIKLNSGLTWEEHQTALRWAKAFEIADVEENIAEIAAKLEGK